MTVNLERTVVVDRPLSQVFDYLSDFTTTNEWDPGTVETVRASGDGGVGTAYRNVSKFAGRKTELTYVVEKIEPNALFALRGENKTVVAHDTMTFRETPVGTEVTYRGDFDFKGLAKLSEPLVKPFLTRLFDEGAQGIREALEKL
jgi:uncharacterized protein YndB with AHSA1/START domain